MTSLVLIGYQKFLCAQETVCQDYGVKVEVGDSQAARFSVPFSLRLLSVPFESLKKCLVYHDRDIHYDTLSDWLPKPQNTFLHAHTETSCASLF